MEIEFGNIATAELKKRFEGLQREIETKICEDQFVGKISDFIPLQNEFPMRVATTKRPAGLSCLVLILESPHKDEFNATPPVPANGITGTNIRSYIMQVEGLAAYSEFGLILMNAIQFQCSLGAPTDCFRDDIFRAVWVDDDLGRSNFQKRLRDVFISGDVIVNCCTKGKKKPYLRDLVQEAIDKINNKEFKKVKRRNHPSCWYAPDRRKSYSEAGE